MIGIRRYLLKVYVTYIFTLNTVVNVRSAKTDNYIPVYNWEAVSKLCRLSPYKITKSKSSTLEYIMHKTK